MFFAVWSCAPFLAGLVLTVALRARKAPLAALWAALVGVAIGIGFFLDVLFSSPLTSDPYNGCSDCESYLGHWWEPKFVGVIIGGAFVFWMLGVGVGTAVTAWQRAAARGE
jgi:hypothetical protein